MSTRPVLLSFFQAITSGLRLRTELKLKSFCVFCVNVLMLLMHTLIKGFQLNQIKALHCEVCASFLFYYNTATDEQSCNNVSIDQFVDGRTNNPELLWILCVVSSKNGRKFYINILNRVLG